MFTRVKQENQVFSIPFQLFLIYLISAKQITQSLIVFTVLRGSALFSKELLLTGGPYLRRVATYGGPLLSDFFNISNLPLLLGGRYFRDSTHTTILNSRYTLRKESFLTEIWGCNSQTVEHAVEAEHVQYSFNVVASNSYVIKRLSHKTS